MSDMTDVLAKHQWYDATSDNEDPATGCTGCDDWFGSEDALDDGTFAAHQAAVLSAAGFGPVQEARKRALLDAAEALDLQPPKLKAQYVSTLRLYAFEAWRLETKRKASDDGS